MQFAGSSVSKPVVKPVTVIKKTNPVISKKVQISKTPQIKTVIKPHHVVAHTVQHISTPKKTSVVKVVSKPVTLKKPLVRIESKVDQAIAEIMLRPLAVSSEPGLRGLSKNNSVGN